MILGFNLGYIGGRIGAGWKNFRDRIGKPDFEVNHPENQIAEADRQAALKHLYESEQSEPHREDDVSH